MKLLRQRLTQVYVSHQTIGGTTLLCRVQVLALTELGSTVEHIQCEEQSSEQMLIMSRVG